MDIAAEAASALRHRRREISAGIQFSVRYGSGQWGYYVRNFHDDGVCSVFLRVSSVLQDLCSFTARDDEVERGLLV